MQPNYESRWWGYIYDQMMGDLREVVDANLHFYATNLRDVDGPVLECACGTGIFLLSLLAAGHDMYGFDISTSMLATLRRKAKQQGVVDIDSRISVQDFESFRYDQQFAAITIPTNTFNCFCDWLDSGSGSVMAHQNVTRSKSVLRKFAVTGLCLNGKQRTWADIYFPAYSTNPFPVGYAKSWSRAN